MVLLLLPPPVLSPPPQPPIAAAMHTAKPNTIARIVAMSILSVSSHRFPGRRRVDGHRHNEQSSQDQRYQLAFVPMPADEFPRLVYECNAQDGPDNASAPA